MKYIDSLRNGMENCIKKHNALLLGEDIAQPYGGAFKVTKGLSAQYPGSVLPMPMCEQGLAAFATGLALTGRPAIAEIMFCDFVTLIADQMINHAAKFHSLYGMRLPLVVRTPAGGYRGYGATHSQCLERLFAGIPGLRVLAPSILHTPGEMLENALVEGAPCLFVENKLDYAKKLARKDENHPYLCYHSIGTIEEASIKDEPAQATLVTYGGMAELCMNVLSELFLAEEIALQLLVPGEVADSVDAVVAAAKSTNVLFVEEGWGSFGMGSEFAAAFCAKGARMARIAAAPHSIFAAKSLENSVLPSKQAIAQRVLEMV